MNVIWAKKSFYTHLFMMLYALNGVSLYAKPPTEQHAPLLHKALHPFHVGLVELNIHGPQLDMAIRVFTDDLEWALSKHLNQSIDLGQSDSTIHDWLRAAMIHQQIKLIADTHRMTLDYVGFEREDDSIWLYWEKYVGETPYQNWSFELTLLTREFPEQRYVVGVNQNGRKKTQLLVGPDYRIQWSVADQ